MLWLWSWKHDTVSGCGERVLGLGVFELRKCSKGCLALGPLLHALLHHFAFYNVFSAR